MTKVRTKRKRREVWLLTWYRPVGNFKNGQRKMICPDRFMPVKYKSLKDALRAKARSGGRSGPLVAFIHRKGWRLRGMVELEVFPEEESYSSE